MQQVNNALAHLYSDEPLEDCLQECIAVGVALQADELIGWARCELTGYGKGAEPPGYRFVNVQLIGVEHCGGTVTTGPVALDEFDISKWELVTTKKNAVPWSIGDIATQVAKADENHQSYIIVSLLASADQLLREGHRSYTQVYWGVLDDSLNGILQAVRNTGITMLKALTGNGEPEGSEPRRQETALSRDSEGESMATEHKIFISHASADRKLADLLRDTLVLGGIPGNRIFYSSSRATGIPSGTDVRAHLRLELQQAGLVIELISATFLTRPICLLELGAAWALEKPTYPIVVPPLTRDQAVAKIGDVHMGQLGSPEDIDDVFDELHGRLTSDIGVSPTATEWNPVARRFKEGLPAVLAASSTGDASTEGSWDSQIGERETRKRSESMTLAGRGIFKRTRVRGEISIGDIRNWAMCLILASIVTVSSFFAFRGWPKVDVLFHSEYTYRPDPHRYICYVLIGIGLIVAVVSIFEGVASRNLLKSGGLLQSSVVSGHSRIVQVLRSIRFAISLVGGLLVFSGLSGFQDLEGTWVAALAAAGGLALLALVSLASRYGGDSLLTGALLLLAGTFVPVQLNSGEPALGISTLPGALAAVAAIAVGIGWYYWFTPPLLALFIAPAIPMVVLIPYNSYAIIGPYVALIACVMLLSALALGAARPAQTFVINQDGSGQSTPGGRVANTRHILERPGR